MLLQVCLLNAHTGETLKVLDFKGPPLGLAWASMAGEEEATADPVLEKTLSVNINHSTLVVCRVRERGLSGLACKQTGAP